MVHMIKFNPSDESPHNHISIIERTAEYIDFRAHREDRAQRRLLPAVVQSNDLLQPDYALVGDDVIIIAPVDRVPNAQPVITLSAITPTAMGVTAPVRKPHANNPPGRSGKSTGADKP